MPRVEELPMVAQKALQAKAGESDAAGLDAQKNKVGFLERLASVGRGKKDEDAEMSPKMEPDFAPTPVAGRPMPRPPAPPAPPAQAQSGQGQAPRPVNLQRPVPQQARPPQRVEAQPRVVHGQAAAAVAEVESLGDDDLEIPAFLRRRAN
jgi:cell division protein FtsZ